MIEINFVKFVCFISLASVQIYIQVVPLCDCNNNIRKQVYMALEQGLFNSTSKLCSYFKEISFLT